MIRENESESDPGSEGEQSEDLDDIVSDEEEEEEQPATRPYMALLQSFNDSSAPSAKRRKLEHSEDSSAQEEEAEDQNNDDAANEARDDVDEVDEEDDAENEEEPDSEDDDELTDPFDVYFAHPNDQQVGKVVKAIKTDEWSTTRALVSSLRATMMSAGSGSKMDVPQPCGLEGLNLKQKLQEMSSKKMGKLDAAQQAILPLLFGYKDIFHCDRTVNNATGLRQAVCLHALNHVFK
jgi:U3 small nucleolar RNA-associated protein 25